jgi:integrase/recombinase XerD
VPEFYPAVERCSTAMRSAQGPDSDVLLSLGYGCGLRAGEVVRLKVKHIDTAQKIIRIEQSKGRKDRNVMLSAETLDLLRQWWKARRSRHDEQTLVQERWLFPGTRPGRSMTTRQLNLPPPTDRAD